MPEVKSHSEGKNYDSHIKDIGKIPMCKVKI